MKHIIPARALSALIAAAAVATGALAVSAQTPPPMPPPPPAGPPGAPGPMPPPGMPMPDDHMRGMHDEMMRMHEGMMRMPESDGDFVRMLSMANGFELDHAKFIINRTKNAEVHAYAQRMIDDHSTAAVKLQAATRGVGLRPAPVRDGRMRRIMILGGGPGDGAPPDFDALYMRSQVPMHRHVLALLQWEEQNGKVAGLKTLASNLMPTVQQHLQIAQSYLAEHHLTPLSPPAPMPVPGHPNPPPSRVTAPGAPVHNPAAAPTSPATPSAATPAPAPTATST